MNLARWVAAAAATHRAKFFIQLLPKGLDMKTLNVSARIITAIALVVNAYIHFVLAVPFDAL